MFHLAKAANALKKYISPHLIILFNASCKVKA
jgi:hypothetical protein